MSLWLRIVPHDERDVVLAGGAVLAHELRDVDARDGVRRHRPGGRDGPVAGVDHAGRGIAERVRLVLHAGVLDGGDLARAHAAVIAEPVDVDPVVVRIGVDLEVDRRAVIDADVGGETLDVRVARAVDAPFAFRIARASGSRERSDWSPPQPREDSMKRPRPVRI